jgi:uncharacterized flavoprotein (TIGR03862 family)
MRKKVAVIGSGPAGLMAASVLANAGVAVTIFERRKAAGRKLLIAGSSGLNISYDCTEEELFRHYRVLDHAPETFFKNVFQVFSRRDWIAFVEGLGLETFCGTSRRYFVREMKASGLLKAWIEKLKSSGVEFEFDHELTDFHGTSLQFGEERREFDAICFALGGGSWDTHVRWPDIFSAKGIVITPFAPSNTGFGVAWPEAFLKEAEGLPLKNVELKTSRGVRRGELTVTEYGLEGTPIYAIGASEVVSLDLKPDLETDVIRKKLTSRRGENLAPLRKIKQELKLCEGSQALLFHLTPSERRGDLEYLISRIKNFPIELLPPRPLSEAISSSGGLALDELTDGLMLKKAPGVFAAGEMLDWDAPTGGFLIQGSVSLGALAGRTIVRYLE